MKKYLTALCIVLIATVNLVQAKIITVNVMDFSFSPSSFTANVGDTVKWVWNSGIHTTTSTSVPTGAATWSNPMDASHTTFLYKITTAGSYAFQCNFHAIMGMTGTFTVTGGVAKAVITLVKAVIVNNCTNTNTLKYKCTNSTPPYKVQLYRYGVVFGAARSVTDTTTYLNLPIGSYYATAFGKGATGTNFGKSVTSSVVPVPTSLSVSRITATGARLKWIKYACVKYYRVQYKIRDSLIWITKNTLGNKDSIDLTALRANTKYQFRVASADSLNKITAISRFSVIDSFVTKASMPVSDSAISSKENKELSPATEDNSVVAYPNPASTQLHVQANKSFISVSLIDLSSKIVWEGSGTELLIKGKQLDIDISRLPEGTYLLRLIDEQHRVVTKKVVILR
jgi:plastocyanin